MADNKPLVIDETTGCQEEVIPLTSSTGAPDANQLVQTGPDGKLDETLLPSSVFDSISLTAGENLTAGDYVTIDGAGEVVRASAASGGSSAIGYVKDTTLSGASVTVYFEGTNDVLPGLTPGSTYFLSDTTPGGVSTTIPTDTGEIVQKIGLAINATSLTFEPDVTGIRA